MCQQLHKIARSLGLQATKETILNEYTELLKDEEDEVRLAAFHSMMDLCSFLDLGIVYLMRH